jgi:hypothetical protein
MQAELNGHVKIAKLKEFAALTRQGRKVTEASRIIGVTPEYACRALKRTLIALLAEKLRAKLH